MIGMKTPPVRHRESWDFEGAIEIAECQAYLTGARQLVRQVSDPRLGRRWRVTPIEDRLL